MEAGVARRDITPPLGTWMSGYAGRGVAESVLDPLELTALAWHDRGTLAVILTFDLLGVDDAFWRELTAAVASDVGTSPEAVLLGCSHTHGGPVFCENIAAEAAHLDRGYRRQVFEAARDAARAAVDALAPAELHLGEGAVTLGINRRSPEPPHRMAPNPNGFYDRTLSLMSFRAPDETRPRVVLFSAACHPTTLGAQAVLSADWPGAARRSIEAAIDGCMALFLQGCCGDIRPRTVDLGQPDRFRPGTPEDVRRIGAVCAHEVLRLLLEATWPARGKLNCRVVDCPLPLENRERLPYRVQAINLGRAWSLVVLPGEPVSAFGPAIRGQYRSTALVAGYCNGLPGYIATGSILEQGGYEAGEGSNAYYGLPAKLTWEAEYAIDRAAREARGRGERVGYGTAG